MSAPVTSPIIRMACRAAARLIQVFAFYVIFHGHYSPGGGFQGGALLAAAVILVRIAEGRNGSQREFPSSAALLVGSVGVLIFAGIGLLDLLAGGNYLQYEYTPLPGMTPAQLHYWGILVVEIGVALAVMAVLVGIFDVLMEKAADARVD
jgi:multicomponent Na+:H+ antiporter subunit B